MGRTARDIDQLSLWEFLAARDGFLLSKGVKKPVDPDAISDEQLARMGIEGFTNAD